jgi:hypothetical protein
LIQQPPLPQKGTFTEAQQAGPYAVGLSLAAGKASITVIGPEGTAPTGVAVTIDHRMTTTCGPGCYRSAASGRNISVQLHGQQLHFQIPSRRQPAAELLRRATRAFTSLHELLIKQVLSSAPGLVQVTQFRERAPDKLSYVITNDSQRAAVGTSAIAIGGRRWDRAPGAHWVESKQTSSKIPSPWWGPESRNAYLVAPNEIAFFDPRIPAWFRLYLNPAGEPVRLGMIAAAHFMTEYYSGFNKSLTVSPP